MAQLNYSYDTPKGVAGGLADISFSTVASRANEENDGVLKFGMAVKRGTTAGTQVKKPAEGTTAADIEGIVVRHANTEEDMNGAAVVKKGATVSVLKHGAIWARLADETAPTPGAKAYVIPSGTGAGTFTATATDNLDIGATFGGEADLTEGIAIVNVADAVIVTTASTSE